MYFFEILENIMHDRNLKISDISKMTDIPDSTLRSIINRKNKTVALDVAFKISKGLNIPIEELNGEAEEYYLSFKNSLEKNSCETNITIFSENLKKIRKSKGLKQSEMAEKLNVGKSTYCQYENGQREPDVLKIIKIAKTLNVSGDELLGIDNKKSNPNSQTIISNDKQGLLNLYDKLNTLGQEKAIERIEELAQIPKYQLDNKNIKPLPINEENNEQIQIVARGKGVTTISKEEFDKINETAIEIDNVDDYF